MTSYYIWFIILAVIAYVVVTDNNVATAFFLGLQIIQNWIQKRKWMLLNDPRNPINKYLIWRRSYKLARELQNEIQMERQSRTSNNDRKTVE